MEILIFVFKQKKKKKKKEKRLFSYLYKFILSSKTKNSIRALNISLASHGKKRQLIYICIYIYM